MLKCKDLVRQADDFLDRRLTWRERLAVNLHLLVCEYCRRYMAQLRQLIAGLLVCRAPATDEEVRRVMAGLDERSPD